MTFFVLEVTSKFTKKSPKTIRLVLASVLGGLYSMIILLDQLPIYIIAVSKLLSSLIIVLVAFSHYRLKSYIFSTLIFFFSSLLVLGIVVGMYMLFHNDFIAINNSAFYFDISSTGLVVAGLVAYIMSSLIMRLYNRVLSSRELYTLVIENDDKRAVMLAILDTGNHLREPFSNTPVIVVNRNSVEHLVGDSTLRFVPSSTVSSHTLLSAFKPDRVLLKTSKGSEVIENAYIAMSDDMTSSGFSAILNPEILSV